MISNFGEMRWSPALLRPTRHKSYNCWRLFRMDDAELAGAEGAFDARAHELALHEREAERARRAREQANFRQGLDDGRERFMQPAFDAGFTAGAEVAFLLGRLRGALRAAAALAPRRGVALDEHWTARNAAVLAALRTVRVRDLNDGEAAITAERLDAGDAGMALTIGGGVLTADAASALRSALAEVEALSAAAGSPVGSDASADLQRRIGRLAAAHTPPSATS
jgi:hypothetical protein